MTKTLALLLIASLVAAVPAGRLPADPAPASPSASPAPASHTDTAKQQAEEEKEGKDAADEIAKKEKFVTDKAVVDRVQAIGAKIAAIADKQMVKAGFGNSAVYPFHYTYHVINSKEINAFSLPGGYIYIYKGLLDHLTTDDEIAGVLGHETAHASHHHVAALMHEENKMSTQLALGALAAILAHVPMSDLGNLAAGAQYAQQAQLNNHFSERAEEDADHTGMIYMQKAGYNPVGMIALLMQLKRVEDTSPDIQLGFLQDHPLTSQRLQAAHSELADLGVPLDNHTMREASGTMIAEVVDQGSPGHPTETDLQLGSHVIFRAAASSHDSVQAAAKRLNALLDNNLQLYEVKANGAELTARNQSLITFTDADAKIASSSTPNAIAANAAKTIRNLLWSQTVTSTPEQEIEVGAQPNAQP